MFDPVFYKTPSILKNFLPQVSWRKKNTSKTIFLTFDDGPIPNLTQEILKILLQFNAKATFFCVGDNIRKYPEIFKQTIEAGHSVGNHTQHHLKAWKTPVKDYLSDIDTCYEFMQQHQAIPTRLFRPPYGQITPKLARRIAQKGYEIIMWDVLSKDYNVSLKAKTILLNTIKHTENGTIIVFHDNLKAENNVLSVLPEYLKHFSELGYQFEKL